MFIKDRIKELRRVKASELRPSSFNWRTHPAHQQDALKGILAEVGYASALLARELDDGTLELIDGHLRAETTPDMEVPVLVLDVSADEAKKILATLDPLGALAGADAGKLDALLADVDTGSEALAKMLADLADKNRPREEDDGANESGKEEPVVSRWEVLIECKSEDEQRQQFERLTGEGLKCRVLSL